MAALSWHGCGIFTTLTSRCPEFFRARYGGGTCLGHFHQHRKCPGRHNLCPPDVDVYLVQGLPQIPHLGLIGETPDANLHVHAHV